MLAIPEYVNKGNRPVIPKSCPQKLALLIRSCWNAKPKFRPDFGEICRMLQVIAGLIPDALETTADYFRKCTVLPAGTPINLITEMQTGSVMLKCAKHGKPHFSLFQLSSDAEMLQWTSRKKAPAETQLRMHDEQFGAILECLRRKGTLDETNIIVLGDHGQTDIRDAFLMNVYFRRLGLLTVDADGKIASFDAVCHSTGLAALIEVRDPDDAALMARVREVLEALRHDPDVQLSMVLDAAEAQARYGLSGPFDFVVESSLPIAFGEYPAGDTLWRSCQPGDKKTGVATHGGSPAREEVTTFFAAGPDVRPGTVHGSRSMVDEAPTMAAMLGLTMPDVDGAPIFEILR